MNGTDLTPIDSCSLFSLMKDEPLQAISDMNEETQMLYDASVLHSLEFIKYAIYHILCSGAYSTITRLFLIGRGWR